jgi:hypothetical protein
MRPPRILFELRRALGRDDLLISDVGLHKLPSWRVGSADELAVRLTHALTQDRPSLIVVPVDYSLDVSIADEFGEEITPT